MPKFVIERDIPGIGTLTPQAYQGIAQKSRGVLQALGPDITWITSYVTGDTIYCVYIASDEELVREHARRGGFPVTRISRVTAMMDPATAEG